ncbi:MAG: hypothetical protein ACRECX_12435 [Methyloceanibacter sp.]|uniref:hypothetical protein n=1 Tax=Methyloceanibacter sp. TaxID=1965321 RepID=UPI003D6CAB1C
MALFAAGIALTALLVATYTGRYTWIAAGSMALSLAALVGLLFLATAKDKEASEGIVALTDQLSPVFDRQSLESLASTLKHVSAALSRPAPPRAAPPTERRQAMQAAVAAPWPEPTQEPKHEPEAPAGEAVRWLLEEDAVAPGTAGGFVIGGVNVSGHALSGVQAILKPDESRRELGLALTIEGHEAGGEAVIPSDARFSLSRDAAAGGPLADGEGAILSFRYTQAGQQKATILYLTAPMVARLANRQ